VEEDTLTGAGKGVQTSDGNWNLEFGIWFKNDKITLISQVPNTDGQIPLHFGLRLQLHLAALHLNRVFHSLAAVLFADFRGLLLNELFEGIDVG
jgi:hypothetical protein